MTNFSNLEQIVKTLSKYLDKPLIITNYKPGETRYYQVGIEGPDRCILHELTVYLPLDQCYEAVYSMVRLMRFIKND